MASNCGRCILLGIWNWKFHTDTCIWIVCKKGGYFTCKRNPGLFFALPFFFVLASLIQGAETPPPWPRRCIFLMLISCFSLWTCRDSVRSPRRCWYLPRSWKRNPYSQLFQLYFCLKPEIFELFTLWNKKWNGLLESRQEVKGWLSCDNNPKHLLPSYQDVPHCYFNL